MEENEQREPCGLLAGKFKDVDALVHAYGELEAEFTRRSQKLKALEEAVFKAPEEGNSDPAEGNFNPEGEAKIIPEEGEKRETPDACDPEERLYRAASGNEEVRARILGDYLSALKGVPLLGGTGTGVTAPANRPKNIRDAGALALGYLKKTNL